MAEAKKTTEDESKPAAVDASGAPAEGSTDKAVAEAPKVAKKKKAKRSVPAGQLHILATFNNTIVTFTDNSGGVLAASSAGACGFRGSKKGTAYAAQVAAEKAGQLARQFYGLHKVDVFVKGIGLGREAAIRSLQNMDIQVESIRDVTSVAHGGVRPRKARRV
jgi:small subunit ribosomal protein S11